MIESAELHGALGEVLTQDRATHVLCAPDAGAARRPGCGTPGRRASELGRATAFRCGRRRPLRCGGPGKPGSGGSRWHGKVQGKRHSGGQGNRHREGQFFLHRLGDCTETGVLTDTLGVIDTVSLRDGGATATLTPARGPGSSHEERISPLVVAVRDTLPWRALVLARGVGGEVRDGGVGGAGVDGICPAGRGARRGRHAATPRELDRSGFKPSSSDVVVVLDSGLIAPDAAAITKSVRGGGGLVLAGEGALALSFHRAGGAGRVADASALAATRWLRASRCRRARSPACAPMRC